MILRKSILVEWLLLIALLNIFFKSMNVPVLSDVGNSLEILILLLIVTIFVSSGINFNRKYFRIFFLYFTYLVISLISSFDSDFRLVSMQLIINMKFFLLLLIFMNVKLSFSYFEKVNKWLSVLLMLNVVAILMENIAPSLYRGIFSGAITDTLIQGTQFKRYSGVFYHPGPMGIFCGIMLMISVIRFAVSKERAIFFSIILSMVGLFFSGQRMELLSAVLIILILFMMNNVKIINEAFVKKYVNFLVTMPVLLFLLYLLSFDYKTEFSNFDNARGVLYIGSIELAKSNFPLGEGLSKYGSSTSVNNPSAAYSDVGINNLWWFEGASYLTDTFWAMIIGESGFIGLLLYLLFLIKLIIMQLSKSLSRTKKSYFSVFSVVLLFYSLIISLNAPIYTGAILPLYLIALNLGQSLRESSNVH